MMRLEDEWDRRASVGGLAWWLLIKDGLAWIFALGLFVLLCWLAGGCAELNPVTISSPSYEIEATSEIVSIDMSAEVRVEQGALAAFMRLLGITGELSLSMRVDLESGAVCGDLWALGVRLEALKPCESIEVTRDGEEEVEDE